MGNFKLNQNFIKKIENECKEKAKNLAHEASEKLTDYYISLIDRYYSDYTPKLNKYGEPYYARTFNLYNSAHKYYKNGSTRFYGGVQINGSGMHDYPGIRNTPISGERLLYKYIYTPAMPSATWHGGDWHGGYGNMARFSIYYELEMYKLKLIDELNNRCGN